MKLAYFKRIQRSVNYKFKPHSILNSINKESLEATFVTHSVKLSKLEKVTRVLLSVSFVLLEKFLDQKHFSFE